MKLIRCCLNWEIRFDIYIYTVLSSIFQYSSVHGSCMINSKISFLFVLLCPVLDILDLKQMFLWWQSVFAISFPYNTWYLWMIFVIKWESSKLRLNCTRVSKRCTIFVTEYHENLVILGGKFGGCSKLVLMLCPEWYKRRQSNHILESTLLMFSSNSHYIYNVF